MKIIKLEAENFKCLKAVEIEPKNGDPVVLTGANAQGKSSILDAIFCAVTGKSPKEAIRRGEEKAVIKLDLGELVITRTFTGGRPKVTVENGDGARFSSPQAMLDGLLAELTLDPLEFSRMKPKEQREALLKAGGVDLNDWEDRFETAYGNRTFVNRQAKEAEINHKELQAPAEDCPEEELSIATLSAELEKAREHFRSKTNDRLYVINQQNRLEDQINNTHENIEGIDEEIENLKCKISDLEISKANTAEELEALEKEINDTVIPPEPSNALAEELQEKLEKAEEINQKVRAKNRFKESQEKLRAARKQAANAQKAMDELEEEKERLLHNADFGLEGLSVDDSGVTYKGERFEQLSTAQQIQVSMAIACNQNPKLNIILIRELALVGKEIWGTVCRIAEEKGFQIWGEKFQEQPGKMGLHIESGQIVAVDGKEAE